MAAESEQTGNQPMEPQRFSFDREKFCGLFRVHGKAAKMVKLNPQIDKAATNRRAIDEACDRIRTQLARELAADKEFFGSVALTIQVSRGVIDRFRVAAVSYGCWLG